MSQQVISAKDFELYIFFDVIGSPLKISTGVNFSANVSGVTEDIGAFSTNEPIGVDNGGTTYDISFALQEAEANKILDALAAATANSAEGSIVHIRQVIEGATITAVWKKLRDVPATQTVESYIRCTGVEEGDSVERRSPETLKTWRFRGQSKGRSTTPL